jgi:Kdo2-lipid IVA lauroyltransferase/acyltransferase
MTVNAQTPKKPKKPKKKHPIRDYIVYLVIRSVAASAAVIPVSVMLCIARFYARLLWYCYPQGRHRAMEHLKASYPEKTTDWITTCARRSFEHIGMLGLDCLLTPRLARKDNWRDYARFTNIERVKWLMQEGQGLVMVTGHYGNFEVMGYILGMFGFDLYSVARPLDNTYLDRYIRSIRERQGQKIIDKKGASIFMSQSVPSRASLGLIADQDAGHKGIYVDFFGRPASTYKSIALIAATRNMPIAVGYSRRVGNRYFFDIGINRIIFPEEWADKKDPLKWITAEYTQAIETFVREDPSQYWWVHRRWKTQPGQRRKRKQKTSLLSSLKSMFNVDNRE